ncbi:uncharacterized protein [Fopius arisanus]|uniref:Gustatory receptor n=1 Tax=Fopius arisanus TaxID=64838 RepID=A0A9R1TWN4_9HYME|nr:PREDICTED: uncharacterized protein LOC105264215 [Fopius arisanus]
MTAAVFTMPLLNAGPQREADLLNSATTIKGVFGITVTIVIWLIIIAQSKMAVKILNRIVEMDKEMLIVQNLCADKSKIQIVIMFMGNCTIWISIFVLEILVVSDWYNVWTPLLLPSMIMNWYIMQYVFMLVMVESRAGSVNRGFIMIAKGRLAAFMYSNPRHTDANERKLVNNFMILRRGHAILAGICRDLSDYYSFPVLPTISFLCCATIYDSYYLILPLVVPSNYTSILEISNMICWLLMETLPVVVLAVYVTRVLNEMEKTGSIVYNVLSRSALIHIAKNELMDFSVELLHRKVRFTAYGIFSLDGTLIRSIFGMLVTYLIILMQFQLNHRSDDELKLVTTSSTISPMSSFGLIIGNKNSYILPLLEFIDVSAQYLKYSLELEMVGRVSGKMKQAQKQSAWVEPGTTEKYFFTDAFVVRLVVIIFKVLGLAPISVESPRTLRTRLQRSHQGLLFKKCIFGVVYIYILIIIVFGVSFITVPLMNADVSYLDADLLDTFEATKGVFGLIVMFVIWLAVASRYKTVLKILNKMVEMDNEMLVLQDLYYLETSKRQILILFLVNFVLWIVNFFLEILSDSDRWKLWTPLVLPSIIMNWYIMQYILILVMIENRFVSVNRGLIVIANCRLEMFFHSDVRRADVSERAIVNNFMTLKRAHSILAGICRDISSYYSFPILPTVAFFCGASIYHSYYVMVPLVMKTDQQSIMEIANMICWLIIQMLPLIVLSVCVTRVLNQMGMTGGTVYKGLARSILNYVAKDELKKFSFELLHKNVQFTAYDIFSLDCTLIQSIFGMLATYLIILVQFQLSHVGQREPSNQVISATESSTQ